MLSLSPPAREKSIKNDNCSQRPATGGEGREVKRSRHQSQVSFSTGHTHTHITDLHTHTHRHTVLATSTAVGKMADIRLVYFNLQARGEPVRLILAAAGQNYEDVRVSFEDWPKEKPNAPYGQLPYVVYKGKIYGQSVALANFFAREFGFAGKTDLEALCVDEAVALSVDFINTIYKAKFESDQTKKEELYKNLFDSDAPRFLGYFQRLLKDNGDTGYLVGKSLTQADLFLYNVLDALVFEKSDVASTFPPELVKLREQVESHPGLKEYLASRPEVKF